MFRNPMAEKQTLYTAEVELEFGERASFSNVVSVSPIANGLIVVRLCGGIQEFLVENAKSYSLTEQGIFMPT